MVIFKSIIYVIIFMVNNMFTTGIELTTALTNVVIFIVIILFSLSLSNIYIFLLYYMDYYHYNNRHKNHCNLLIIFFSESNLSTIDEIYSYTSISLIIRPPSISYLFPYIVSNSLIYSKALSSKLFINKSKLS